MERSSLSMSRVSFARVAIAAFTSAAALSLAACVAVPVDVRTGQPIGWPSGPTYSTQGQVGQAATIATPAPAVPPSPVIYTARLYPVNDVANRAGMLTAMITDGHGGRGIFSLNYLGDAMQGEASRVEANYPGFGRIHRDVLGVPTVQMQGPRGIANAVGGRAISAQCEYVLSGPSKGTGACVFSDGARYQLHFG
jgi:hypothetical protein